MVLETNTVVFTLLIALIYTLSSSVVEQVAICKFVRAIPNDRSTLKLVWQTSTKMPYNLINNVVVYQKHVKIIHNNVLILTGARITPNRLSSTSKVMRLYPMMCDRIYCVRTAFSAFWKQIQESMIFVLRFFVNNTRKRHVEIIFGHPKSFWSLINERWNI